MRRSVFGGTVVGILMMSGCGPAREDRVGNAKQNLFNAGDGKAFFDNQARPQALWLSSAGGQLCGGVLVASNVVLTAAHCVDANVPNSGPFYPTKPFVPATGTYVIFFSANANASPPFKFPSLSYTFGSGNGGVFPALVDVIAHPDYPALHEVHDLALLILPQPVSRHIMVPAKVASALPGPLDADVFGSFDRTSDCGAGPGGTSFMLGHTESPPTNGAFVFPGLFEATGSHFCKGDSGSPIFEFDPVTQTRDILISTVASNTAGTADLNGSNIPSAYDWLFANGLDRDHDGIPASEDNCDTAYNPGQSDINQDGVGDECDPCPAAENWWEHDADSDGIPDCIDPCPNDAPKPNALTCANPINRGGIQANQWGDTDCDGICDAADNCINTPNTDQRNANDVSETKWNAEPMGDACEPALVPDAVPGPATTVLQSITILGDFFQLSLQDAVQNQVQITPMRSRRARDLTGSPTDIVPAMPIATHARFCQPGALVPSCTAFPVVDDKELHLELQDASFETALMPYHRMTLSFSQVRGASTNLAYNDSQATWTWDYTADAAFWQQTMIVSVPPPASALTIQGGPASGLDGTFWTHAASSIGHPGDDIGTGTHGPPQLAGTQQLSNHYFPLRPEAVTMAASYPPLGLAFPPFFIWRTLPDPAPEPFRFGVVAGVLRGDDEIVVPGAGSQVGLLDLDGTAQRITDRIGPALLVNLNTPGLVWVSASEPGRFIGERNAPIAVALSSDGSSLVDRVTSTPNGFLLGAGDRADLGDVAPGDPPSRQGFVPVYTRTFDRVFVIGGTDATGKALGTITRINLDGSSPAPLGLITPVDEVQAATFDHLNLNLYVLDKHGDGSNAVLRLLEIDAMAGGGSIIASWPADAAFNRFFLTTDRDGSILLSASGGHHVVWRIRPAGFGFTAQRVLIGPNALATAPLVGDNGYIVYEVKPSGTYNGTRFAALPPSTHGAGDHSQPIGAVGSLD